MVPVPGGYCHFRLVILNLQTLLTYPFGQLVFIGIPRIALVPELFAETNEPILCGYAKHTHRILLFSKSTFRISGLVNLSKVDWS